MSDPRWGEIGGQRETLDRDYALHRIHHKILAGGVFEELQSNLKKDRGVWQVTTKYE